jgi:tRNA G18 (ribose-2'-O)-methylase SpoU
VETLANYEPEEAFVEQIKKKKKMSKTSWNSNMAILVGNEGSGVSNTLLKHITDTISLPMHKNVESINVGAAVSVFVYEHYRQLSAD